LPPRGSCGARSQIAIDDLVDDSGSGGLRGRNRLAVGAHLDRERHAGQAGQPLRAAGTGDDAKEYFGLSDLGILHRDAVVTRHRHLEPAAERLAVNGGDERLRRILEAAQQRMRSLGARHRLLGRLQDLEDVDVGARDEGVAGADQHDRVSSGIAIRAYDPLVDRFPDPRAQCVDGRVIDREDRHAVDYFVVDEFRHNVSPQLRS
jgi:hypothetical protein